MRGTKVFVEIAKEFKKADYEIDLSLMAVPKLESYGSTLLRYATDLMQNNSGRWVSKEIHDESYDKFVVTLNELSKQNLFDRAEVYRRGKKDENGKPHQIYSTEGKEFESHIDAILYGRENYIKDAVDDYTTKHDLVCEIFSKKAPNLLSKLREWEELYEIEKQHIKEEQQTR